MVRNALLCLRELFAVARLGPALPLDGVCGAVLHRLAQGDKRFICQVGISVLGLGAFALGGWLNGEQMDGRTDG